MKIKFGFRQYYVELILLYHRGYDRSRCDHGAIIGIMIEIEKCADRALWDEYVCTSGGHPLQLWGWGELKSRHNWRAERLLLSDGGVTISASQVLYRNLPKPFGSIAYIPRGPVGRRSREVYRALADYVRNNSNALALTVEPDNVDGPDFSPWRRSKNRILMSDTLILDLTKTSEDLMSACTKKTRQYIRKSAGEGLVVREIRGRDEMDDCLKIYKDTARRAGFGLHDDSYYYDLHGDLGDASRVFGCYAGDELLSFLWMAVTPDIAFELYGGVSSRGQEMRANYTLKWECILQMQRENVRRYDMNGLVSEGVGNFKTGFADHTDKLAGTFDMPLRPPYHLWSVGFPLLKSIARIVKR